MDPTQNQSDASGPIFSAGAGPEEPPMTPAPTGSGPKNPFSNGGDIILQPESSSYGSTPRSKKPLIIGAVVVALVLILLVTLLLLGNDRSAVSAKNLREKFHRYTNLMLYGENSVEDKITNTEYDATRVYKIEEKMQEDTHDSTYFQDLEDASKQLLEEFQNNENLENDLPLIDYQYVKFLRIYQRKGYLDGNGLAKAAIDSGKDLSQTKNYIDNFYNEYTQIDSDIIKNQIALLVDAQKERADYIIQLDSYGCIVNSVIDYDNDSCDSESAKDTIVHTYQTQSEDDAILLPHELLIELISDCWSINSVINEDLGGNND